MHIDLTTLRILTAISSQFFSYVFLIHRIVKRALISKDI